MLRYTLDVIVKRGKQNRALISLYEFPRESGIEFTHAMRCLCHWRCVLLWISFFKENCVCYFQELMMFVTSSCVHRLIYCTNYQSSIQDDDSHCQKKSKIHWTSVLNLFQQHWNKFYNHHQLEINLTI